MSYTNEKEKYVSVPIYKFFKKLHRGVRMRGLTEGYGVRISTTCNKMVNCGGLMLKVMDKHI